MPIKSSLSRKLIKIVLLVSSLVTVFTTAIQITYEYQMEKGLIDRYFDLIEKTYVSNINLALWEMNTVQLDTQLAGLLNVPNVRHIEITDTFNRQVSVAGSRESDDQSFVRTIPLTIVKDNRTFKLGTLRVESGTKEIYENMRDRILLIFLSQMIKTLLVSSLLLLIFHKFLTRHILHLTEYVERIDISAGQAGTFKLLGKRFGKPDELDRLGDAVNNLHDKLVQSYDKIANFADELQEKLDDNTLTVQMQRQKLESSARLTALGEMAGGIAHEINTPLGTIVLRSEQIGRILKKDPPDLENAIKFSGIILSVAKRIEYIVKSLRIVSRTADADSFIRSSLKDIVQETLALSATRLENRGVKIIVDEVREDLQIECKPVQISQILLNLISNAQDAVRDQTEDRWIRIEIAETEDNVRIGVIDSGHGIPTALTDKILLPFFTTKPINEGTGLGLSISKGIAEAHGGSLVYAAEQANTTFYLTLPKTRINRDEARVT